MWVISVYSCLCISDRNRFYEDMAMRGLILERSNEYVDFFYRSMSKRKKYAVMPKSYFRSLETMPSLSVWELVAENKSYAVYAKDGDSVDNMPYSVGDINGLGNIRILGAILFFFFLYQMMVRGMANSIMFVAVLLIGIAMLWSHVMESFEMEYFKKHHVFLHPSNIRYYASLVLLTICNLVPALFVISILVAKSP